MAKRPKLAKIPKPEPTIESVLNEVKDGLDGVAGLVTTHLKITASLTELLELYDICSEHEDIDALVIGLVKAQEIARVYKTTEPTLGEVIEVLDRALGDDEDDFEDEDDE